MDKKYILGVDGGNTKTDYFLFDTNGNFVDFLRSGTCSHERFPDSFEASYRIMREVFDEFFSKNNIKAADIYASVFGLAGVDTPYQKMRIEEVVGRLGFNNYKVINDSFLGIKGGSPNGIGVCSINGTGTSAGGIDAEGNYLQVGGIGAIVGDEAGGSYIARCAVRACYDEMYRFGKKTSLSPFVMEKLGVTDKYYLMEKISGGFYRKADLMTEVTIKVFEMATAGDEVCLEILTQIGENLARSAGGAVVNLNFGDEVNVILAGSVWVKGSNPAIKNSFAKNISEFTKKKCNIITLDVPPATGAVIWALELAIGQFPEKAIRDKIIENVVKYAK